MFLATMIDTIKSKKISHFIDIVSNVYKIDNHILYTLYNDIVTIHDIQYFFHTSTISNNDTANKKREQILLMCLQHTIPVAYMNCPKWIHINESIYIPIVFIKQVEIIIMIFNY